MKNTNFESLISRFIVEDLDALSAEELEGGTNLIAEGILDSISAMRLVNHIETRLQIKIPPRDLIPKNFITLAAIVAYLESRSQSSQ